MNLLIQNGRLLDPSREIDEKLDVLIEDGRISKIGRAVRASASVEKLNAEGLVVCPGFIDLHTHLREPGQEHKETIRTGTAAAVAGGFTAVCAMANTEPVNDERSVTEMVVTEAARSGSCRVYPIGAVSRGLKGADLAEMAELRSAGCVGFSDDGMPVANSELMRRALEYSRMLGLPIIAHEEDPLLSEGGVMHEGYYSTLLGLRGIPAAAEETMAWRDVILAGMTGGHLHIAHLSTGGSVDAVRHAKKQGMRVTCEVAPHHFALTDAELVSYSTSLKMKPPLRSKGHLESLFEGFRDGTVDAIATDHAPHHEDEKDVEFDLAPFGIIGLETAFAVSCEVLVHGGVIPLERLVALLTSGPAAAFSLPGGSLAVEGPGDVTLFDPERPRSFDRFASRSSNSPWLGKQLRGAIAATIVGGEIRYRDESILRNAVGATPRRASKSRGKSGSGKKGSGR